MKKKASWCRDPHLERKDKIMCFCMKEANHKGKHKYGTIMYPKGRRGPEITTYYEWNTRKKDKITQLTLELIDFYTVAKSKYNKKTIDYVFHDRWPNTKSIK